VRGGSGCFVTGATDTMPPPFTDGGPSPFEVVHARVVVEGETARLAAENATPEDVISLEETVTMLRADIASGGDTRQTDRLFHVKLAEVAGNSVLTGIVADLWGYMTAPVFEGLGANSGLRDTDSTTVIEHMRVIEAVAARNARGAQDAMAAHLDRVRKILLEGDAGEGPGDF
jgi:DNA-binding FadR family transcriptional regulator